MRFFLNQRIFGYKLHVLHGAYAWELQVGRHVFQRFYAPFNGRVWHHWIDPYGT